MLRVRFSAEQSAALADVGSALIALGQGLLRFTDAAGLEEEASTSIGALTIEAREVEALWKRLGPGTRELLVVCAQSFEPGVRFTLDEMADAAGTATGSVKARLMNIGRSLKSLGTDFTVLWDSEWGILN